MKLGKPGDYELGEMLHRAPKPPCGLQQTKFVPRRNGLGRKARSRGHTMETQKNSGRRLFSFLFLFGILALGGGHLPHVTRTHANTTAGYHSTAAAACLPRGSYTWAGVFSEGHWMMCGSPQESCLAFCPEKGFRPRTPAPDLLFRPSSSNRAALLPLPSTDDG